jgi:hypothetical protein
MSILETLKTAIEELSHRHDKNFGEGTYLERLQKSFQSLKLNLTRTTETLSYTENYPTSQYFDDLFDVVSQDSNFSRFIDVPDFRNQMELLKTNPGFMVMDFTARARAADKLLQKYRSLTLSERREILQKHWANPRLAKIDPTK